MALRVRVLSAVCGVRMTNNYEIKPTPLHEAHALRAANEAEKYKNHYMPEKKPQYVLGCPYEVIDIDPEKERNIWRGKNE